MLGAWHRLRSVQEVKYRLGVGFRLLDIGDVSGVETGDFCAFDLLLNRLAGRWGSCRVVRADNDQSWSNDAWVRRAEIHVRDRQGAR